MVLVVVLAVMMFLLMYLVPQVTALLKTMGLTLPLQTRMLIGLSDFTATWWPAICWSCRLSSAAGIGFMVRRPTRAPATCWDYANLRLPVTGAILQKIILARFANFFALMYRSGITILDAIKTSEDIVGNRVIADGLQRAGQQINAGESLLGSLPEPRHVSAAGHPHAARRARTPARWTWRCSTSPTSTTATCANPSTRR